MKKTIRLTERELIKVIENIVKEQIENSQCTQEEAMRMEKEFNKDLAEVGLKLSDEEMDEIQPNCPIETDLPSGISEKEKDAISDVLSKMGKMNRDELKTLLKKLIAYNRTSKPEQQSIAESSGLKEIILILGIGAASWVLLGPFVAFLIVAAIILLSRLIFRGPCAERRGRKSGCSRRKGLGSRRRY